MSAIISHKNNDNANKVESYETPSLLIGSGQRGEIREVV